MRATTAGTGAAAVDAAWDDARRAARTAHVQVHPATLANVTDVQEVLASVWGPAQRPQTNLVMAMSHAGATIASAQREGVPLGACVGFLGWDGGLHLHSHMVAVHAGARVAGVGYALKLWQRARCLDHGVDEIRWTYDPLVRRNAYFNLAKLGARVVDYRPDFYGEMDDIVNAGDRSDRFEVSWALGPTTAAGAPTEAPASPGPSGAGGRFVALPPDYERLRQEDPEAAGRWRGRVRAAIAGAWGAGLRPVWAPAGGYTFLPAGESSHHRG